MPVQKKTMTMLPSATSAKINLVAESDCFCLASATSSFAALISFATLPLTSRDICTSFFNQAIRDGIFQLEGPDE